MRTCSATISECGPVRAVNADAVVTDDTNGFYAIADGVGSTPDSVAASRFAVQQAHAGFLALAGNRRHLDLASLVLDVGRQFQEKFAQSSRAIGTTLTVVAIGENSIAHVSVGDSPLFLLAEGRTALLTKFHTMVDQKVIISDFSEMKSLNGSNYLYNTLGRTLPKPIEYDPLECAAPFRALLCTDGFMELTNQSELAALNAQCASVSDFVAVVSRLAANKRLPDNYSAILIEASEVRASA